MKPKSRNELDKAAKIIWQDLELDYQPCEAVYIISELTKRASLAMLQRELAREEEDENNALLLPTMKPPRRRPEMNSALAQDAVQEAAPPKPRRNGG